MMSQQPLPFYLDGHQLTGKSTLGSDAKGSFSGKGIERGQILINMKNASKRLRGVLVWSCGVSAHYNDGACLRQNTVSLT